MSTTNRKSTASQTEPQVVSPEKATKVLFLTKTQIRAGLGTSSKKCNVCSLNGAGQA